MQIKGIKQYPYCIAYHSDDYKHICLPFLNYQKAKKELKEFKKLNNIL